MRKFKKLLLALTIFQACSGNEVNNKNSETSTQKTVDEYESRFKERSKIFYDSNKHLSIVFFQDSLKVDFITTSIPDESDLSIKLCIPAAFSCGDYICGKVVDNGSLIKTDSSVGRYEGYLLVNNGLMMIGKVQINPVNSIVARVIRNHSDYFEQLILVWDGKPNYEGDVLRNLNLFIGRAIVQFEDDSFAIVQTKNTMNRKDFSDALAEIGVKRAVYVDMGSYGYGWYRDSKNRLIPLLNGDKKRQTNWLIFREMK